LRNPIVPAITILLWESINGILPAALQKLSVLYYVQSLWPGSGADRSGRAAADSPAARARRASIGYTCGAWIVRGDGAGALGGVKGGAAAGNQLWDRLSVAVWILLWLGQEHEAAYDDVDVHQELSGAEDLQDESRHEFVTKEQTRRSTPPKMR